MLSITTLRRTSRAILPPFSLPPTTPSKFCLSMPLIFPYVIPTALTIQFSVSLQLWFFVVMLSNAPFAQFGFSAPGALLFLACTSSPRGLFLPRLQFDCVGFRQDFARHHRQRSSEAAFLRSRDFGLLHRSSEDYHPSDGRIRKEVPI